MASIGYSISESERMNTTSTKSVLAATIDAFVGEQRDGQAIKSSLRDELFGILDEITQFHGGRCESDEALLTKKLFRFRPRLVGAIGAYSSLTGIPYNEIVEQKGLDSFYLFWALGSIQDDFIDEIPKEDTIGTDFQHRRGLIGKAIFGDDKRFYRAAYFQLRQRLFNAELGDEQKAYILGRITDWYRFLARQEAKVLDMPFDVLSFNICRQYREEQNLQAGSTLVSILNGQNCLRPEFQRIEPLVAQFSFLTQIIDDIADTGEDLTAMRPSYAVGALVDNPKELVRIQEFIAKHPYIKITPRQFRRIAPQAYTLIHQTFNVYCSEIEKCTGKDGLTRLAGALYSFYPTVRNILFKVNANIANF